MNEKYPQGHIRGYEVYRMIYKGAQVDILDTNKRKATYVGFEAGQRCILKIIISMRSQYKTRIYTFDITSI